jgi:hypothetical protein
VKDQKRGYVYTDFMGLFSVPVNLDHGRLDSGSHPDVGMACFGVPTGVHVSSLSNNSPSKKGCRGVVRFDVCLSATRRAVNGK